MTNGNGTIKIGCGGIVIFLLIIGALVGYPYFFGNKKFFDTGFSYKYADIHFPNGSTKTIEISKWMDYEGEQIQIWGMDGTVYLVSSFNTILRSK